MTIIENYRLIGLLYNERDSKQALLAAREYSLKFYTSAKLTLS